MLEIHHFTYGWVTPVVAYIMSVIGCLLGLRCTVRARSGEGRRGWLIAAAVAIGGTGVWVMHFVAMLGFSIHGANIRYNVPITLLSAAIAIAVVWAGLWIVASTRWGGWELLAGGTVTGLGVSAMHYAGMYAMNSDAAIDYSPGLVALSVVIGVVASIVALWFTLNINRILATVGAALIMGVAVCGMHYTGMASMSAHQMDNPTPPSGVIPFQLLAPLMVSVTMVTLILVIHVGLTEVDEASRVAEPARPEPAQHDPWSLRSSSIARTDNSMAPGARSASSGFGAVKQDYRQVPQYPTPHQQPEPYYPSQPPLYAPERPGAYPQGGLGMPPAGPSPS
ncbi:MHYT domain-containing protein [Nocardia sp. NPDC006630]|uniref:MHYT domain-containing protein n=1 Tax=Nocardia sp. NPDC006630 TaxID=3157181 RepID=UPI0033B6B893